MTAKIDRNNDIKWKRNNIQFYALLLLYTHTHTRSHSQSQTLFSINIEQWMQAKHTHTHTHLLNRHFYSEFLFLVFGSFSHLMTQETMFAVTIVHAVVCLFMANMCVCITVRPFFSFIIFYIIVIVAIVYVVIFERKKNISQDTEE